MGKKKQKVQENGNNEESKEEVVVKEGENLLGAPKFKKLENGRLKCVETGHELPAHAKDSYAQTKHCRLGLIESFLIRNKPPLNMFTQDPVSSSKLTCKLTGLTVNKSEEHIWKHINGKRFLNMLDKKEAEKEALQEKSDVKENEDGLEKKKKEKEKEKKKKKEKKKDKKNNQKMQDDEENSNGSELRNPSDEGNISEEVDFWIPPSGERWDFDHGAERWGSDSDSDSGPETEDVSGTDGADEENESDVKELSKKFEVLDEEPGDDEDSSGQRKYKLPMSHIIPFPKRNDPTSAQDFPMGRHVLAVYPGTTALYKATVVLARKRKTDDYILEFDDDEEDGSLPQRSVPFHKVVALPEGHGQ